MSEPVKQKRVVFTDAGDSRPKCVSCGRYVARWRVAKPDHPRDRIEFWDMFLDGPLCPRCVTNPNQEVMIVSSEYQQALIQRNDAAGVREFAESTINQE